MACRSTSSVAACCTQRVQPVGVQRYQNPERRAFIHGYRARIYPCVTGKPFLWYGGRGGGGNLGPGRHLFRAGTGFVLPLP